MIILKVLISFISLFIRVINNFDTQDNLLFGIVSLLIFLTLFFSFKVYISILKQNTVHYQNIIFLNKQFEKIDFNYQKNQFSRKDFNFKSQGIRDKIELLKSHILGVNLWLNSQLSK